jgi:hypothetical protein
VELIWLIRGKQSDEFPLQKEPQFWDIFPENPQVYQLVVEARSLKVLRMEENRSTKEKVIRYTRQTVIGEENVDIASSWEETVQVLEVLACRGDREEIDRQVNAKLEQAETDREKQQLYQQFMAYLNQRQTELEKEGGKDSLIYKREAKIIQDVITRYKLPVTDTPTEVTAVFT